MFIGIAMFFVLMLMGGLIAFLGDKIGSKVGKKRMTLFGLRPKYTSVIVTIISGILIHISIYPITKFKILIYTKSEKLIYI